jgi:ParB-like chromosome segregation protein Spo0J
MKLPNHLGKRARARRAKLLKVIYRSVDALKLDPANPRVHSKKQIRQLANSIEAFDFNVPILIDRDGKVVAGHGRLLACRELGITEVPTLCPEHLSPA